MAISSFQMPRVSQTSDLEVLGPHPGLSMCIPAEDDVRGSGWCDLIWSLMSAWPLLPVLALETQGEGVWMGGDRWIWGEGWGGGLWGVFLEWHQGCEDKRTKQLSWEGSSGGDVTFFCLHSKAQIVRVLTSLILRLACAFSCWSIKPFFFNLTLISCLLAPTPHPHPHLSLTVSLSLTSASPSLWQC